MSKHVKFELQEFPKSAVVNSRIYSNEKDKEQIVSDIKTDKHDQALDKNVLENGGNDNAQKTDEINVKEARKKPATEERVDIEKIKQDAYESGKKDAGVKYEETIERLKSNNSLAELLHEKLSSIVPSVKIDEQVTKLSAEAISGITKKLHLILPANFEEIIKDGLIKKLEGFYTEGDISLTVNPSKKDFCTKSLQSDAISSKFKDNFQIIEDSNLGTDDCKLEWNNTRLEYNKEQINAEIDKIIEQLKTA
ncbi:FliH/SctL family protein [Rickettsiaceae bacterium]|nr:FliH/SctL family protein [Rickettsiaceae bacterium]